jgi:hypothetical protein
VGLTGQVLEHQHVRLRAVEQPLRDGAVARMQQRALPLEKQQIAALATLIDQRLGGPVHVIGDAVIDGDPPPRDRDARLAGCDEDALATARNADRRALATLFGCDQIILALTPGPHDDAHGHFGKWKLLAKAIAEESQIVGREHFRVIHDHGDGRRLDAGLGNVKELGESAAQVAGAAFVDDAAQHLKQAWHAVNFVQDDQLVALGAQKCVGVLQPHSVGWSFQIEVG